MRKLIITVAPVSAGVDAFDPVETANDVIQSVKEGASIVHLHVRDENAQLTEDLTTLKKAVDKIAAETDAIIQISTGGVSDMTIEQRCAPLFYERTEMASLNVGSVNLGEAVYMNPIGDVRYCVEQLVKQNILPDIEVFELGMIHTMKQLSRDYALRTPTLYNFILGAPGAAPATSETLFTMRSFLPPDALWGFTHVGRERFDLMMEAIFMGASVVRLGFEDSYRLDESTTASCNSEIVARLVRMAEACGIQIATPQEARDILGVQK